MPTGSDRPALSGRVVIETVRSGMRAIGEAPTPVASAESRGYRSDKSAFSKTRERMPVTAARSPRACRLPANDRRDAEELMIGGLLLVFDPGEILQSSLGGQRRSRSSWGAP